MTLFTTLHSLDPTSSTNECNMFTMKLEPKYCVMHTFCYFAQGCCLGTSIEFQRNSISFLRSHPFHSQLTRSPSWTPLAHHEKTAFCCHQICSATTCHSIDCPRRCSIMQAIIPSRRPPGGFLGRIVENLAAGIVCDQRLLPTSPLSEKLRLPKAFGSHNANNKRWALEWVYTRRYCCHKNNRVPRDVSLLPSAWR